MKRRPNFHLISGGKSSSSPIQSIIFLGLSCFIFILLLIPPNNIKTDNIDFYFIEFPVIICACILFIFGWLSYPRKIFITNFFKDYFTVDIYKWFFPLFFKYKIFYNELKFITLKEYGIIFELKGMKLSVIHYPSGLSFLNLKTDEIEKIIHIFKNENVKILDERILEKN